MGHRAEPQRLLKQRPIELQEFARIAGASIGDHKPDVVIVRGVGTSNSCEMARPSSASNASRLATSTTLIPDAAICRANSLPIPDEAPVTSAQGPNRLRSTLACIAHRHFRVAHEAAISSLLPGPLVGQALYLAIDTKIAVLAWVCQEIYILTLYE